MLLIGQVGRPTMELGRMKVIDGFDGGDMADRKGLKREWAMTS